MGHYISGDEKICQRSPLTLNYIYVTLISVGGFQLLPTIVKPGLQIQTVRLWSPMGPQGFLRLELFSHTQLWILNNYSWFFSSVSFLRAEVLPMLVPSQSCKAKACFCCSLSIFLVPFLGVAPFNLLTGLPC